MIIHPESKAIFSALGIFAALIAAVGLVLWGGFWLIEVLV
tara:strand:- start:89 stop:208 length:120 start_codon:yes stop_codon:yes gene_type:complete